MQAVYICISQKSQVFDVVFCGGAGGKLRPMNNHENEGIVANPLMLIL